MSFSQPRTTDPVDLAPLSRRFAKRWKRVAAFTGLAAGAAFTFATLTPAQYRAETRLMVEAREPVSTGKPLSNEAGIASQAELISSTDVLSDVARKLDLADRAEFDGNSILTGMGQFLVLAGLRSDPAALAPEERVLEKVREKLDVSRVENSRVIVIRFASRDPKLAADVPNAIADAYLALRSSAAPDGEADATSWLKPEIDALTTRVKVAEAKVAQFQAQSGLLAGGDNSALAAQRFSELSTELSRVRTERTSAEASAQGVRTALSKGLPVDGLPDVLASPLVQRLRERQVQIKADLADLGTTLLDNHPRMRALRSQLSDLDTQIRAAAQNVLQNLSSKAETARLREIQLTADLNGLKAETGRAGEDEVELRALDREASAQRELLQSYLTRYREAASRRDENTLPAEARVFSRAVAPVESFYPRVLPITIAAALAALLLTAVTTLLQELLAGQAVRPAQLRPAESEAALLPAASEPELPLSDEIDAAPVPSDASDSSEAAAVPSGAAAQEAAQRLIVTSAKRAIFVSPEGDEAAAASVLVAREAADAGLRVLLLDLSASGAASRPMLEGGGLPGISNLLASEAQFGDIIRADHFSDCHVIPAGTADREKAMRAFDRLPIIMQSLTTAYDLVVVECGAMEGENLSRLAAERTVIMVAALNSAAEPVEQAVAELEAAGFDPMTVSAIGELTSPEAGRDAA